MVKLPTRRFLNQHEFSSALFFLPSFQANNGIELTSTTRYDILHASPSPKDFIIPRTDTYPSELMVRKTMDRAYDNPAMILKD